MSQDDSPRARGHALASALAYVDHISNEDNLPVILSGEVDTIENGELMMMRVNFLSDADLYLCTAGSDGEDEDEHDDEATPGPMSTRAGDSQTTISEEQTESTDEHMEEATGLIQQGLDAQGYQGSLFQDNATDEDVVQTWDAWRISLRLPVSPRSCFPDPPPYENQPAYGDVTHEMPASRRSSMWAGGSPSGATTPMTDEERGIPPSPQFPAISENRSALLEAFQEHESYYELWQRLCRMLTRDEFFNPLVQTEATLRAVLLDHTKRWNMVSLLHAKLAAAAEFHPSVPKARMPSHYDADGPGVYAASVRVKGRNGRGPNRIDLISLVRMLEEYVQAYEDFVTFKDSKTGGPSTEIKQVRAGLAASIDTRLGGDAP
ncbi:hypothetical protein F4778DRAFT_784779 [Xylariomycetidae sp. FL2044]|nr:hypothetical protein F4778DRAFT_784779 [Xylariomycetidae sp. FL2044]